MQKVTPVRAMIARTTLIILLLALSGCAALLPETPEPVADEPVVEPAPPQPEPEPAPQPTPPPPPPPVPVVEPEPEPDPEPANVGPLVAVVISDRTPAYVEVADALNEHLENAEVYDLSDGSLNAVTAFDAIGRSDAVAVVAIGLPAARAAAEYARVPVVVGQVFNFMNADLPSSSLRAVSVLPPIATQVDAWLTITPAIRNVGAIVGPGHEALIEETERALQERGIKFHYAIAGSDRETLYLFNRLVRDIDGFLLFPDNRVLSRNVLTEMMSYAARHHVQVAVFNEPLLQLGAVISTEAVNTDIADSITIALNRIIAGEIDDVPTVSPLSTTKVSLNPAAMQKLGLTIVPAIDKSMADSQ